MIPVCGLTFNIRYVISLKKNTQKIKVLHNLKNKYVHSLYHFHLLWYLKNVSCIKIIAHHSVLLIAYKFIIGLTSVCMLSCSVTQSCPTLCDPMDYSPPTGLFWNFLGKNPGVSYHFLLQRIFSTQRLNLCLLHWQEDSFPLSYLESPGLTRE